MRIRTLLKNKKWFNHVRSFLIRLFYHPAFLILTVFGNTLIVCGAAGFYYLESGLNPNLNSPLDALYWSVSTITTVGCDIFPVTSSGKIFDICVMILGTAMFWSYTALFAEALLVSDISDIESELKRIEKIIKLIDTGKAAKDENLQRLLKDLRLHLSALQRTEKLQ